MSPVESVLVRLPTLHIDTKELRFAPRHSADLGLTESLLKLEAGYEHNRINYNRIVSS
jgi:hypothetical protein